MSFSLKVDLCLLYLIAKDILRLGGLKARSICLISSSVSLISSAARFSLICWGEVALGIEITLL